MSLEDFSWVDSGPSLWNSTDKIWEVSEVFKEAVKRASSWIKRTQKDEKKAKKHDLLLANFLVKIIINKKYDPLLDYLFKSIDEWYTSNFLLWILSLINVEISNKIREFSNKNLIKFDYLSLEERIDFNDNEVDEKIRDRINFWIEDMVDIISIEYSSLLTEKLLNLLKEDKIIIIFMSNIFTFFLDDLNINISKSKSDDISLFILSEIKKSLKNLDIEEI